MDEASVGKAPEAAPDGAAERIEASRRKRGAGGIGRERGAADAEAMDAACVHGVWPLVADASAPGGVRFADLRRDPPGARLASASQLPPGTRASLAVFANQSAATGWMRGAKAFAPEGTSFAMLATTPEPHPADGGTDMGAPPYAARPERLAASEGGGLVLGGRPGCVLVLRRGRAGAGPDAPVEAAVPLLETRTSAAAYATTFAMMRGEAWDAGERREAVEAWDGRWATLRALLGDPASALRPAARQRPTEGGFALTWSSPEPGQVLGNLAVEAFAAADPEEVRLRLAWRRSGLLLDGASCGLPADEEAMALADGWTREGDDLVRPLGDLPGAAAAIAALAEARRAVIAVNATWTAICRALATGRGILERAGSGWPVATRHGSHRTVQVRDHHGTLEHLRADVVWDLVAVGALRPAWWTPSAEGQQRGEPGAAAWIASDFGRRLLDPSVETSGLALHAAEAVREARASIADADGRVAPCPHVGLLADAATEPMPDNAGIERAKPTLKRRRKGGALLPTKPEELAVVATLIAHGMMAVDHETGLEVAA